MGVDEAGVGVDGWVGWVEAVDEAGRGRERLGGVEAGDEHHNVPQP